MNYFEYPQKGTGQVSYLWNGQPMSLDFSSLQFDWQNMADIYNSDSTAAQKTAVATLMKACGYAMNSEYGTAATSASVYLWAPALVNYFGYAPSLQPVNRIYYTLSDWENLIYNSLQSGSPVLYSGIGATVGHAFVCDGYSADGYFHFNWGWSGLSNGYFLLSALNPSALGIGGGSGGFNSGQIAVVNIKPSYSGAAMTYAMGLLEGTTMTYSNVSRNFSLVGGFMNLSNNAIKAKVGFEVTASDGTVQYAGATGSYLDYPIASSTSSIARRLPELLPDGTYRVRPAFAVQVNGEEKWYPMLLPATMKPYWQLVMANGKGTLEAQQQNTNVTVTNLRTLTTPHRNCDFKVGATIANRGETEFMSGVYVTFTDNNGKLLLRSDANPVDIMKGDSVSFEALVTPSDRLPAATVNMHLEVLNEYNSGEYLSISPTVPVNVLPYTSDIELKATEFYVENADSVNTAAVALHITAKCTKGYYANPLRVWVREAEGSGSWGTMMLTPFIFLDEGEQQHLVYTFQYPQGEKGKKYNVVSNYLIGNSQAWFGSCDFTVDNTIGVDAIEDDAQTEPLYFTLQGIKVAQPSAPGIYIEVRGKKVRKLIIP